MGRTQAFIRVGIGDTAKNELVKKGDILLLKDGSEFAFMEMKRTKWIGKCMKTSKTFNIPVYARPGVPYAIKLTGKKDTELESIRVDINTLVRNEFIKYGNSKETFMFKAVKIKRTGQPYLEAIDVATGQTFRLGAGPGSQIERIDVELIKKK